MAIFRCSLIGGYLNQLMVNVLHFQNRGGAVGDMQDLAPRIDAWHTTAYAGIHNNLRSFSLIDIRQVGEGGGLAYAVEPTTKAGTNPNANSNPAEAIVISLKSVYADRRRNGRIYIGGFPSTFVGAGRVVAAQPLVELMNFCAATMALFGPNGSEPWVVGTYSDPGPNKLGQAREPIFTPTAQMRVNLITGAQRRRRIGVGT